MNSATLSSRPAVIGQTSSGAAGPLLQLWHATRVTVGVVLSARHHVHQIQAMQRLLRQSNRLEATNPGRAAALRSEAAALID